ncbi:hypothetical protein [Enterovibrio norvegicus]|nr:hypothetical protein [Enterovibrio norvegicus]
MKAASDMVRIDTRKRATSIARFSYLLPKAPVFTRNQAFAVAIIPALPMS